MSTSAHATVAARIGPNAIVQLAEALRATFGAQRGADFFRAAGLAEFWSAPPQSMVDEASVLRLHRALRAEFDTATATRLARDAGRRTGDYLLAHRIPRFAQAVLKRLPAPLASRMLLTAIRKHAWTFAGSGVFTAQTGRPTWFRIADCPMCRGETSSQPLCDYYAATFERLFRVLVHPATTVAETSCQACGADACTFEARW
ncbi:MAG: bacteriochlorophyll 4-vinyl reductase [Betaproteobacteria bacterium]